MNYIALFAAILAFLIGKYIYDKKNSKKKILDRIEREWGEVPTQEYTSEKWKALMSFYQDHKKGNYDVDDITWNDLDMNQVYMLLNNTNSSMGEEYLYYVLRALSFDEESLKERNRVIEYFLENKKERTALQVILGSMGKLRNISLYDYLDRVQEVKKHSPISSYLSAFGLLFSLIFIFFKPSVGVILTVIFIANNIIRYYKRKAQIEGYFQMLAYIIRMLNCIQNINKLTNTMFSPIKSYTDSLKEANAIFKKFKKGAYLVVGGSDMSGDLIDILFDYIRMLFHVDLIKFDRMMSILQAEKEELNKIYETLGFLDSMIAVASYRTFLQGQYCLPILHNGKDVHIEARDVYHPMLDEPVLNSIKETKSVLITGSNASGKSTFIKTMAINAILSQTIFTSLSSYYEANYFQVYSSMALRDDIFSNESYYIVEIKSLKRILDRLGEEYPVLCFVDEVLRGTNTLERIAASSQILYSFNKNNGLCFAATHDIELAHILEKYYSNYHFQERIENDEILFDYVLYEGRAVSKNAIQLLKIIGYQENIIESATELANHFLKEGVWSTL